MADLTLHDVEADHLRVSLAPFRINLHYWRREVEIHFERVKAGMASGAVDLLLIDDLQTTAAGIDVEFDRLDRAIDELGDENAPETAELGKLGEAFHSLRLATDKMIDLERAHARPH